MCSILVVWKLWKEPRSTGDCNQLLCRMMLTIDVHFEFLNTRSSSGQHMVDLIRLKCTCRQVGRSHHYEDIILHSLFGHASPVLAKLMAILMASSCCLLFRIGRKWSVFFCFCFNGIFLYKSMSSHRFCQQKNYSAS